ncbi:MAG: hypothetical protein IKO10_06990 [Lachnospiraceae bacterium]|nr:hypothetical protein [Lachnospiraceae bacterium]
MEDLYSQFPYDDAFRTMESECDDILLHYVNFCHGTAYDKSAKIIRRRNEHFIENDDHTETKRVTDSMFEIVAGGKSRKYHHECESGKYDGTVLIRMFEYGAQIALDTNRIMNDEIIVEFPIGCILMLRNDGDPPKEAFITMRTPGGEVSYPIRVIRMTDLDIDYLFDNRLYFLIPFFIFNIEKQFSSLETDAGQLAGFGNFYAQVLERLEKEELEGRLSAFSKSVIISLTHKVAYNLARNKENIQGKVDEVMGGQVIELDVIKAHREGRSEGEKTERENGIRVFIEDKIDDGISTDIIQQKLEKRYHLSPEEALEYIKKYANIRTA